MHNTSIAFSISLADILVVPEYPVSIIEMHTWMTQTSWITVIILKVDGIGHFGLPIIQEEKILLYSSSASARDEQDVALLLAKVFAEFVRHFDFFSTCENTN